MTVPLSVLEAIPEGLFATPAEQLIHKLEAPTLLHIPGLRSPPLFISVLLHGNETSGWQALCRLLHNAGPPDRSIILFIGNIEAASQGLRSLPGQMDFNRIWQGQHPYTPLASSLLAALQAQPLFAALDLHNNTGRNPHYSVLTEITPQTTALAFLFSNKAVLVEEPDTVLTRAVQHLCPATTVELGPINDPRSTERCYELLRTYVALDAIPNERPGDLIMHRALARVHVIADVEFDFADDLSDSRATIDDLVLTAGMEAVNFHPITAGTEFGFTRKPLQSVLRVLDPQHQDVTTQYLEEIHGDISLVRSVIPAMYTTDREVIRQDCLCYLMEEI